jgi:hypothetical protein
MNTFVRDISNHTDSYVIPVSGLPYNATLKLENVGASEVIRPKVLVNGRPDWTTIDAILRDATKPGMSDREKALALWQFARVNRYHWWPPTVGTMEDSDPVKLFSVYGYGFCGNVAAVLSALWERAGLPSRSWTIGPNGEHQASEAFFDGGWHLLDADRDGLYLDWDNTTIAGVVDLIDDPALVSRAGPEHADLVGYYANTPKDAWLPRGVDIYATGHEIGMTLRPHESLTLEWSGGRGYHDDSGAGGPAPPAYGNGQIVSAVDLADPGYGQLLVSQSGLRSGAVDGQLPRLGPAGLQAPGEFVFRVDSPYPIIGARLDADVRRVGNDDTIDVNAVGWSEGINLINESLSDAAKEYRLPGVFVSESNINTFADDGAWPPIHTTWGMQPASVVYRLTPSQEAGARVLVGGVFYRYSSVDRVGLSISVDGVNFQPLWTADLRQLNYFNHLEDVTDAVRGLSSFLVRYDLNAGYEESNWSAGIASFDMRGVSPPQDSLAFTTSGSSGLGDYPVSVDLTGIVARPTAAAAYHYLVRVSMRSSASVYNVGINSFSLTTTVQVAPSSLPALAPGDNVVTYSDGSLDPVALQLTHSWNIFTGGVGKPAAPSGPLAPADGSDVVSAPIGLAWGASTTPNGGPGTPDPDGSWIVQYHVEICDRSDCAWPLSPIFDVYTQSSAPSFPLSLTDWLAPGRRYYWRVQAEDSWGAWSEWGPVWSFVSHVPQVLTVSKAGSGGGTVSSIPAGIQCGAVCSASFAAPTVALTATPEPGSFFAGWSGSGCLGTGTCTVSAASTQTITPTFNLVTAPTVTTEAATLIGQSGATLSGTVNPNGASTTTAFEYGLTTAYGSTASAQTLTGFTAQVITADLDGLSCETTYHFQAKGTNSGGTGTGPDATFTTAACPGAKFYTVSPCRVVDTRGPTGPYGGPALSPSGVRTLLVAGTCGIPVGASAVALNVTAVDAASAGALTIFPGTGTAPDTNTLCFAAGRNRANNAMIGLVDGMLSVIDVQQAGTVHLIVDVNGYYQ